jgi:hypothetical protein
LDLCQTRSAPMFPQIQHAPERTHFGISLSTKKLRTSNLQKKIKQIKK